MPGGLLGAISGILTGGILGFGAAEWIVLLDTFARSCFLIWCFVFVSVQDFVIQRHHQPPIGVVWSVLVSLFGRFCLLSCVFCFVASWLFPFLAQLDFGLRNGPHSTFDFQCGT